MGKKGVYKSEWHKKRALKNRRRRSMAKAAAAIYRPDVDWKRLIDAVASCPKGQRAFLARKLRMSDKVYWSWRTKLLGKVPQPIQSPPVEGRPVGKEHSRERDQYSGEYTKERFDVID